MPPLLIQPSPYSQPHLISRDKEKDNKDKNKHKHNYKDKKRQWQLRPRGLLMPPLPLLLYCIYEIFELNTICLFSDLDIL